MIVSVDLSRSGPPSRGRSGHGASVELGVLSLELGLQININRRIKCEGCPIVNLDKVTKSTVSFQSIDWSRDIFHGPKNRKNREKINGIHFRVTV
jgi:hypothetical protein